MLEYFALGMLIFTGLTLVYGIVYIHDIPYEMAKSRNHPHQDAIHVAGWISMFTLHSIWPFLWIWATIYRPERGYGFGTDTAPLIARIEALERELAAQRSSTGRDVGQATPTEAETEAEAEYFEETLTLSNPSAPGTDKSGEQT